jgi:hypothetical protein
MQRNKDRESASFCDLSLDELEGPDDYIGKTGREKAQNYRTEGTIERTGRAY